MICVLKQDPAGEITCWFIAADVHDARRRAWSSGDVALAGEFYRMESLASGKHKLPGGVTVLVD